MYNPEGASTRNQRVVGESTRNECGLLRPVRFLSLRRFARGPGSCVMRSFGVADRDPNETLFYFEYVRAR